MNYCCIFLGASVTDFVLHNNNNHHHRFTAIIQANLRQPAPPVKNWRILLVQSFTARMPLLMATSAFRLDWRGWGSLNSIIYTLSPYRSAAQIGTLLLLQIFLWEGVRRNRELPRIVSNSPHLCQSWTWVHFLKPNPTQSCWTQPNPRKLLPDPTQPIIVTQQLKNYTIIGYTTNHTDTLTHKNIHTIHILFRETILLHFCWLTAIHTATFQNKESLRCTVS